MRDITIYTTDGMLKQTVTSSTDIPDEFLNSVLYVKGVHHHATSYFNIAAGQIDARPIIPILVSKTYVIANGVDATSLTNLPDPCTVTYTGPGINVTSEVTGGTATFTTDTPGTHTVKVVAFPYLDWEGTFNAI